MERTHDFIGDELACETDDFAIIIPVPAEFTTSYMKGTAGAPEAILAASVQLESYHPDLDIDLAGSGISTAMAAPRTKDELVSFIRLNRDMLRGAFPCFIGGEHSITPWILEGLDPGEIGIVWLDAHADMREDYHGDAESHACAARNSIPFGKLVEVGVRSYSAPERDYIERTDAVSVYAEWNDDARNAIASLPQDVYLSIDYDALDVSLLRAVGTPEPGGLAWKDLTGLLDFVFESKRVIAVDAVELCPSVRDETSNFVAARIIFEILCRKLLHRSG